MRYQRWRIYVKLGIVAAVLLWKGLAGAAFDTGNELYQYCTAKAGNQEFAFCLGLVTGYYEGFTIGFECPGAGPKVTREQLKDIVVRFLEANPSNRHMPGAVLAGRAYLLAFNCKKAL